FGIPAAGWLSPVGLATHNSPPDGVRIMIFGPKKDGTYVVEFRTAAGEALAISIRRNETAVIRHFQERMPYGLFDGGGSRQSEPKYALAARLLPRGRSTACDV